MRYLFSYKPWAKIYGIVCLIGFGLVMPANAQTASAPQEDLIFVEEEAHPKKGMDEFYKHVRQNLAYPDSAKKAGVKGRVFVQFVVETDGSLSEVKVIRGIGRGCDEEAIRLIKTSPPWQPARYQGKAVATEVSLPIRFDVEIIKNE